MTPVSLLASISDTSGRGALATAVGERREIDAAVRIDRHFLDGVARKPAAGAHRSMLDRRYQKPVARPLSPAVSIAGVSASILASVPLEVKNTSPGRAPTSAATCSRASSISAARGAAFGMDRGWIAGNRKASRNGRPRLTAASAPSRSNRNSCAPPCLGYACFLAPGLC